MRAAWTSTSTSVPLQASSRLKTWSKVGRGTSPCKLKPGSSRPKTFTKIILRAILNTSHLGMSKMEVNIAHAQVNFWMLARVFLARTNKEKMYTFFSRGLMPSEKKLSTEIRRLMCFKVLRVSSNSGLKKMTTKILTPSSNLLPLKRYQNCKKETPKSRSSSKSARSSSRNTNCKKMKFMISNSNFWI